MIVAIAYATAIASTWSGSMQIEVEGKMRAHLQSASYPVLVKKRHWTARAWNGFAKTVYPQLATS